MSLPLLGKLAEALRPYGHTDAVSGWVTFQRESDDRLFVFGSSERTCEWDTLPYMIEVSFWTFLVELQRLRAVNRDHVLTGVLYTNCWLGSEKYREPLCAAAEEKDAMVLEAISDLDNLMECLKDRGIIA